MISEDKAIEIIKLLVCESTESLGIKLLYDELKNLNLLYQDGTIKNDHVVTMGFSIVTLCLFGNFRLCIDYNSYTTIDVKNSKNFVVLRIQNANFINCLSKNKKAVIITNIGLAELQKFLKFLKTFD